MTKLRKTVSAAIAVATLATSGILAAPISQANAGYYSPGYGFYGRPYYQPRVRRCWWERVPYRYDYYGRPIRWRKIKRCGW